MPGPLLIRMFNQQAAEVVGIISTAQSISKFTCFNSNKYY